MTFVDLNMDAINFYKPPNEPRGFRAKLGPEGEATGVDARGKFLHFPI